MSPIWVPFHACFMHGLEAFDVTALSTTSGDADAGSEQNDDQPHDLCGVLDQIADEAKDEDEVEFGIVFDAFGHRAFGPIILVPAVLLVTPLGAVPVLPSIVAVFIVLISAQHAFGKDQPWLPKRLLKMSVSGEKVVNSVEKAKPWAKRVDSIVERRLEALVRGPMPRVMAVAVTLLALGMIPLELIPFAVMVPAAAIAFFGLALVAEDGLMALAGFLATAATVAVAVLAG